MFTQVALKVVPSVPQRNPGRGMGPPERRKQRKSLVYRVAEFKKVDTSWEYRECRPDVRVPTRSHVTMPERETSCDRRERGTREMPRMNDLQRL